MRPNGQSPQRSVDTAARLNGPKVSFRAGGQLINIRIMSVLILLLLLLLLSTDAVGGV